MPVAEASRLQQVAFQPRYEKSVLIGRGRGSVMDEPAECPLCSKTGTKREVLRHLKDSHAGRILSQRQLNKLGAKHCEKCCRVLSNPTKGSHKCVPLSTATASTSHQLRQVEQEGASREERGGKGGEAGTQLTTRTTRGGLRRTARATRVRGEQLASDHDTESDEATEEQDAE